MGGLHVAGHPSYLRPTELIREKAGVGISVLR